MKSALRAMAARFGRFAMALVASSVAAIWIVWSDASLRTGLIVALAFFAFAAIEAAIEASGILHRKGFRP